MNYIVLQISITDVVLLKLHERLKLIFVHEVLFTIIVMKVKQIEIVLLSIINCYTTELIFLLTVRNIQNDYLYIASQ